MRIIVSLDDEILHAAKSFAESRSMALGSAISVLVRRGLKVPCPTRRVNGLLVFDPPADSAVVTSELVRRLDEETP
jgi:hypothetical protein